MRGDACECETTLKCLCLDHAKCVRLDSLVNRPFAFSGDMTTSTLNKLDMTIK